MKLKEAIAVLQRCADSPISCDNCPLNRVVTLTWAGDGLDVEISTEICGILRKLDDVLRSGMRTIDL